MRAILALFVLFFATACQPANPPAPHTETATTPVNASSITSDGITLMNGWASVTPGGVAVSAGYVEIANTGGEADRLVSASSPRAGRVEIHEMSMTGGVMQMRALDGLDIPVGATVALAQGGNHLMFEDVTAPFVVGETIPVTLHFEKAGDISVSLPVQRLPAHSDGH